jgi:hypothetical protein
LKPELQIAKDLALPIGAVTQTIAILGVRGKQTVKPAHKPNKHRGSSTY